MATKVYGCSDDLVEIEGDVRGEVGCYGAEKGVLVMCSDGTLLEVKYGKADKAIWGVRLIEKGALFGRIDLCTDEEALPYSDVAFFADGLNWAYAATDNWERMN